MSIPFESWFHRNMESVVEQTLIDMGDRAPMSITEKLSFILANPPTSCSSCPSPKKIQCICDLHDDRLLYGHAELLPFQFITSARKRFFGVFNDLVVDEWWQFHDYVAAVARERNGGGECRE